MWCPGGMCLMLRSRIRAVRRRKTARRRSTSPARSSNACICCEVVGRHNCMPGTRWPKKCIGEWWARLALISFSRLVSPRAIAHFLVCRTILYLTSTVKCLSQSLQVTPALHESAGRLAPSHFQSADRHSGQRGLSTTTTRSLPCSTVIRLAVRVGGRSPGVAMVGRTDRKA